jgi:hypothetical protein
MAEVGPRLGDVILIDEGNEKFDHVEFVGCIQAVYVLHGEIVFTGGVVQLIGSENRLVAGGTEMNGDDVARHWSTAAESPSRLYIVTIPGWPAG